MKTLVIYDFNGETRREEFDDKKALDAKLEDLKANRLVRGYKLYTLTEVGSYDRPSPPPKAAVESDEA